jgi:cobaltochelatase CobS
MTLEMAKAFNNADRQGKATMVARHFGISRNDVLKATVESMTEAFAADDPSLLVRKDGTPITANPIAVSGDLADMIAKAIEGRIHPQMDRAEIEAIIDNRLKGFKGAANTIEVKRFDGSTVNVGRQHMAFADLLFVASQREHAMLVGPAGSGKTTAAEYAAKALGLKFFCQSMGPQTSQANLLGYMDANGNYVAGLLYEPFTEGGLVCIDEIDNSNPGVLTVLNSALSNGYCSFPCGMARKHDDFVVVACANTWGKGADAQYVGRQQLDAATLNRFTNVEWNYDEEFEMALVEGKFGKTGRQWTLYVQALRHSAERNRVRVILSPRQSLRGARFLTAGMPAEKVEQLVLWNGVATDDRQKITAGQRTFEAA